MAAPNTPHSTSVRLQILQLAKQHSITTANVSLEKLAAFITRLGDDNLHTDDIQLLLVILRQKDILNKEQFANMLRDYLKDPK